MKLTLTAALLLALPFSVFSQSTTGDILGLVQDGTGAVVSDARVTVRSLDNNASKDAATSSDGTFRFPLLPTGSYEVLVEKTGFSTYRQGPIVVRLNQSSDLRVNLQVSSSVETISVTADAPIINTTNGEIGTNFDAKRIADLPLTTNRNVLGLLSSVPGVSQLSPNQSSFGASGNNGTEGVGLSFSANGMRLRSNAFIIDGQDSYYPSTGGLLQPLNNPEIISEARVISNQPNPEYGRAAGSVVNIITKSGTNDYHGSLFWFHNDNKLNALSNSDKLARRTEAPFRTENQFGGTFGGKIIPDRTFFFVSLLRWTDRRLGSGSLISGAPSEAGRGILEQIAGTRASVRALLDNLPAGTANGNSAAVTAGGQQYAIPLGNLIGSANTKFDDWQYSYKVDHRFSSKHALNARYMDDDSLTSGTGQATPAGLTNTSPAKIRSASVGLTSAFAPTVINELRTSYSRFTSLTTADNAAVAERIPSLEVRELGLLGFNAGNTRTAIGLATNYPQSTVLNNYQVQDSLSVIRGSHNMKFGIDFRRQEQFAVFLPNTRGRLEYATLQRLVDDQATVVQVSSPLRGGEEKQYYRYYDYFFFLQDEWRISPSFTLTYGVRYESPGNPIANLAFYNDRIVSAYGNDERFRLTPVPERDTNNWAPRIGFNYRFPELPGVLRVLSGEGKLVMRGGYSRTYDPIYNNIPLNIGSAFPFVQTSTPVPDLPGGLVSNSFQRIADIRGGNVPPITNPNLLQRTTVSSDFRAPLAEQIAVQLQRELAGNFALSVGYVGTKGTGLFQSIDGNPTVIGTAGRVRRNPEFGVIRERCNCTSSTYHSMQASLERRLARNFAMAAHYTWSSFIDGASEVFNPSGSSEIAFPQDPDNRNLERGRSSYDRPHRLTLNGVFELPFYREQQGFAGKLLGGWQLNGFLTLQAGPPFTPLNAFDPGGRLTGNLVGTATRPNLNTDLDLASMTVREIQQAGGARLFSRLPDNDVIGVGNVGRNVLRADGLNRVDLGIFKTILITESHKFQVVGNFFNLFNVRDYGIPDSNITSSNFLNEGANEVSARRIQLGLRYTF